MSCLDNNICVMTRKLQITALWSSFIFQKGAHDTRKPDFVECEQQRRRPDCVDAQAGLPLCYSMPGKCISLACYMQIFNILASICSRVDCFESDLVANPEERFSRYKLQYWPRIVPHRTLKNILLSIRA